MGPRGPRPTTGARGPRQVGLRLHGAPREGLGPRLWLPTGTQGPVDTIRDPTGASLKEVGRTDLPSTLLNRILGGSRKAGSQGGTGTDGWPPVLGRSGNPAVSTSHWSLTPPPASETLLLPSGGFPDPRSQVGQPFLRALDRRRVRDVTDRPGRGRGRQERIQRSLNCPARPRPPTSPS